MDLKGFSDQMGALEGLELFQQYAAQHGIESASRLTVMDDETAALITKYLWPRIEGKTVIDVGGGIGLLSLHLGEVAARVYCVEANPVWASLFVAHFWAVKSKHVSYLFGAAEEFVGQLHADVAVFCTHSGVASLRAVAGKLATEVIDVYGEIIDGAPGQFHYLAQQLRRMS